MTSTRAEIIDTKDDDIKITNIAVSVIHLDFRVTSIRAADIGKLHVTEKKRDGKIKRFTDRNELNMNRKPMKFNEIKYLYSVYSVRTVVIISSGIDEIRHT